MPRETNRTRSVFLNEVHLGVDFKDKASRRRCKLWTHPLKQWFSELAVCPQGHLAMSGDFFFFFFDCLARGRGATGLQWEEARDAAYPSHSAPDGLTTKNYPVQNVSG